MATADQQSTVRNSRKPKKPIAESDPEKITETNPETGTGTGTGTTTKNQTGTEPGTTPQSDQVKPSGRGTIKIENHVPTGESLPTLPTIEPVKRPRKTTRRAKKTEEQSLVEAVVLLSILDTLAISLTKNQEFAMNALEKSMIEPPLQRILDRLPINAQEKIGTFSDPLLLLVGLVMWGNRVRTGLKAEEEKPETETREPEIKPVKPAQVLDEKRTEPGIDNSMPNLELFRNGGRM